MPHSAGANLGKPPPLNISKLGLGSAELPSCPGDASISAVPEGDPPSSCLCVGWGSSASRGFPTAAPNLPADLLGRAPPDLQTSEAGGASGGSSGSQQRRKCSNPLLSRAGVGRCPGSAVSGRRATLCPGSWAVGRARCCAAGGLHAPRTRPASPEGKTSVYSNFPK